MKYSLILSGILMLGSLGAMYGFASGASFSDVVTSNGNTFAAGTLFLSVDANCGKTPDAQARTSAASSCSRGVSFSASAIKPGDSPTTKAIAVRNDGSIGGTLTTTQTVNYSDGTNCGPTNWSISSPPAPTSLTANGGNTTYNASVQLLSSAGNGCQGQSATVNLSFSIS